MTKNFSEQLFEQCRSITEVYQTGVRTAVDLHHKEVDALRAEIQKLQKEIHGLKEQLKRYEGTT